MIRPYQKTDTDQIVDVWYQSTTIAHPFFTDPFLEQERHNVRHVYLPNTKTWVYEQEDKVVAFISMIGNEVGAIFALPQVQGQGIGRALMDYVVPMHPHLEVEVFKDNAIGRRFYDRYGFTLMHEHVHEQTGHALLRMRYG